MITLTTAPIHHVLTFPTQGELDVGYRITVAGRDGKLYHIRNGELTQTIIQLEAQPVGLVGAWARMYCRVCIGTQRRPAVPHDRSSH